VPHKIERCLICDSLGAVKDQKITYFQNLVDPFTIQKCLLCGFRWLDPQPTKEEYRELYSTGYLGAQRVRTPGKSILSIFPPKEEQYEEEVIPIRLGWFKSRLKRLRKLTPYGKTLLDIGAGTGDFVALALEEGWRAEGLEVSSYACERAHEKYGLNLICADIDEFVSTASGQFDVIHLSHVFEHLIGPREFLDAAKKLLSPNGVLIIEVPNQFRSWADRLVALKNNTKQIERSTFSIHHPYYYGLLHVHSLLIDHGFTIVSGTTFLPERVGHGAKEYFLGIVDYVGNLWGSHGRNVEIVASYK